MKEETVEILLKQGLQLRSWLGQPVFVKDGAESALSGIFADEWTVSQLRCIADAMEQNPECGLILDGFEKQL